MSRIRQDKASFMSQRSVPAAVTGLVIALVAIWSSSEAARADDAPGHATAPSGSAAEVAHGPATASGGDAHHIDYNQAPLPGSAPGLGTLFVFSLLLFTAFVFGARTLVWTPLIQALDQREARINQAHSDAKAAQHEAQRLLAQFDARMAEVQGEVQGIVAQARKEAESEKARIIAEADAQARALRERAMVDIRHARDAALSQLDHNLDAQVSRAVAQVVGHPV